jgi:hypothetical protein
MNRKLQLLVSVAIAIISMGNPRPLPAVDYYVSTTGNDKNSGISPESPFLSLNHAILQCNSGADRVFVAGGSYVVSVSRNLSSPGSSLQIIGDTTGKFTGVAGYAEIISPPGSWAINLRNGGQVGLQGLRFRGNSQANHFGVNLNNIRQGIVMNDCQFESLRDCFYANDSTSSVEKCQFKEVSNCALNTLRGSMSVRDCQFSNCRYGVYGNTLGLSVNNCGFDSDGRVSRLAVYSNRSSLSVAAATFRGYNSAIQSDNSTALLVQDCDIENITSYGVYATGNNLQVANVTVKCAERRGHGVCLRSTDRNSASITDTTVFGADSGILSYDQECTYRNVRLENNRIGFYSLNAGRGSMRGDSGLLISNNQTGIYVSNPANTPGSFEFQGMTVSDNDYGLHTVNTSVSLQRCNFSRNSRGLYVLRAPSAALSRCEFVDNNLRNTWSHWGARLESAAIAVEGCTFERNDTGLVLVNQGQSEPRLSDVSIRENVNYGLMVYGGPFHLSDRMLVQVQGSRYGLWTQDATCTIERWNSPTIATYPFHHSRGSLVMTGCNVVGGTYGVVTDRTTAVAIQDSSFVNCTSYSVYDNLSRALNIEGCSFVEGNHLGIYANQSQEVTISACKMANLTHSAIYSIRQARLRVANCSIDTCKQYGIYCTTATPPADIATFNNLEISNCQYGIRTIGIPVHERNLQAVGLFRNQQALRVEQAELRLSDPMQIHAEGNQYAFMCISGSLRAEAFTSSGNSIGLYTDRCAVALIGANLDCTQDACLLYGSRVEARDLRIRAVRYGLFFDSQRRAECFLDLDGAEISVTSQIGLYTIGRTQPIVSSIRNVNIEGGRYGLYANGGQVEVENLSSKNAQVNGIFSQNATSTLDNVTVENSRNWSISGNSGTLNIINSRVFGGNGILLNTTTSGVVNCLVSCTTTGIQTNNRNGRYQIVGVTLADILRDGLNIQRGRVTVLNSIIHAGRFGILRATAGSLLGEHNLVMAGTQNYRNVQPGTNDVEKMPIFVNAPNRDYRLDSGSPAINAGKDLTGIAPQEILGRDILGNARGSFGGYEIGAFEYMEKSGSLRIIDWRETAN